MPFIERQVDPKYLSRTSLRNADGSLKVTDEELQAVTNNTLSNALKQLASLVFLANDIFNGLAAQLKDVAEKSQGLQTRIVRVGELVEEFDPKTVPVPEGSLSNFASRKVHFTAKHPQETELFTPTNRPKCVQSLYESASKQPLHVTCLEDLRRDVFSSPFLICTPVLGSRSRRMPKGVDIDIETMKPAAIEDLRKWTSKEAIGEVSALTDASVRITSGMTLTPDQLSEIDSGDEEPIDHLLPSPEEQLEVIVHKFAPELVRIDTTGRFFDRMCNSRKSLIHFDSKEETDTVKRRGRSRKPRGKRRNTIAGTDQKELREAIVGESTNATTPQEILSVETSSRSKSGDLLSGTPPDLAVTVKKPSHFDSLKRWSRTRLRSIGKVNTEKLNKNEEITKSEIPTQILDDSPPKITTSINRKRRSLIRTHERTPSHSSTEAGPIPVRLRDRRLRRTKPEDEPHSSSGNWSASSESGRTSLASDAKLKHPDASSEGTLTPEVAHEDLETGSEYSCDTEGYYTSFHVDSGLKTLREEEPSSKAKQETDYELFGRGSTSTTASSAGTLCTIKAASERDLSAPTPPERASSLTEHKVLSPMEIQCQTKSDTLRAYIANRESYNRRKIEVDIQNLPQNNGATSATVEVHGRYSSSPDSGHNTSSSPIDDSISSNAGKHSPSERDYSSCSDLEGADRTERIRSKVAINSSRIPSMCVITPAASDDEGSVRSLAPIPMPLKQSTIVPLVNIVGKLKSVFPQNLTKRLSPQRAPVPIPIENVDPGEYVTIADVENNNKKPNTYDVCKNLRAVLSGDPETEYVSLNELPDVTDGALGNRVYSAKIGAKVTLDSEGKVVYTSDSLRRRRSAHTTFEPGPYVNVVTPSTTNKLTSESKAPLSPQMKKIIIKAPVSPFERTTADVVNMPAAKPNTIIIPTNTKTVARVTPNQQRSAGAYVNIQEAEGVSLSPTKEENKDSRGAVADTLPKIITRQHQESNIDKAPIPQSSTEGNRFNRVSPMFWTMRPPKPSTNTVTPLRSLTPDLDSPVRTFSSTINRPSIRQPVKLQPVPTPPASKPVNLNEESLKISPIDPRQSGNFQSSTPSKENVTDLSKVLSPVRSSMTNEELYAVIHKSKKKLNIKDSVDRCGSPALSTFSLSPVSSESSLPGKLPTMKNPESGYLKDNKPKPMGELLSNRSETSNFVQNKNSSNCRDRLGPIPQTSRLDFKRLLLQHGVKLAPNPRQNTNKISAVEQLKISKDSPKPIVPTVSNLSQVNILDLSGSPKMYSQRKFPRNQPTSTNKNQVNTPKIVLSPKSQWRFSSPRSDVLSTPIMEVNNEEEIVHSSCDEKNSSQNSSVAITTGSKFGARRTLIPIDESTIEKELSESKTLGSSNPFRESTPNSGDVISRAELQAKRAQFFSSSPDKSPPGLSSFKNPFHKTPSPKSPSTPQLTRNSPSPPALETAL